MAQGRWPEPAWEAHCDVTLGSIHVESIADAASSGRAWASIWTEPFEVRESTLRKAKAAREVQASVPGEYNLGLSARKGKAGEAQACAQLAVSVEKYDRTAATWKAAEQRSIAAPKETNGSSAYGKGVGTPAENPHYDGFEARARIPSPQAGGLYRVRLRMEASVQAGADSKAASDGRTAGQGARMAPVEISSW